MRPTFRKLGLTAHVTLSVGWLGAVCVFVALGAVGLTSREAATVRSVYLAMQPAATFALVPLAVGALLTGIIQALGTPWGLFRHYWVLFKLLISTVATAILVAYLGTFAVLADAAADPSTKLGAVRSASPVLHSVLALLALLLAMVLALYKPRGMTRYGWRKAQERGETSAGRREV